MDQNTKIMTYQAINLPDRIEKSRSESLEEILKYKNLMKKRHTIRDFSNKEVDFKIIENAIEIAGLAPSGANKQPWHFTAISDQKIKTEIRHKAEEEEKKFYSGGAGDEWINALEPMGTNFNKPHLEIAPWLIVIFSERYELNEDGTRHKNYYVNESIGIASGFLISALHIAGLSILTHTPNPMLFLNQICERPKNYKPIMILAVGYAAENATVPKAAKIKKPLREILTKF